MWSVSPPGGAIAVLPPLGCGSRFRLGNFPFSVGAARMNGHARLFVTGIREAGCTEFRITVYGAIGRELPPAVLIASLADFRAWIGRTQGTPDAPARRGGGR